MLQMPAMHTRFNLAIPPLRPPVPQQPRLVLDVPSSIVSRMQNQWLTTRHPIESAVRSSGINSTKLGGFIAKAVDVRAVPLNNSLFFGKMSDMFTNSGRIQQPGVFGGELRIHF
jgi:hypothetical protein